VTGRTTREPARRRWLGAAWGVALAAVLGIAEATAADLKFMGVSVEPAQGTYEAITDSNIRAAPANDAKRLGNLPKGTRVEAVGKVKGGWIAVRRGGDDLGFVFESLLKAVNVPARQAPTVPPLPRDPRGRVVGAEGKPIAPASGTYLVIAEASARAQPSARAAKRGDLDRGDVVEVIGSAENGSWLAVRKEGQELGFAAAESLVPLIDGTLTTPVNGTTKMGKTGNCRFTIQFSAKNPVEGEIFQTSDYDVDWRCEVEGRNLKFPGVMFITEAPFQLSSDQAYQISVDLPNVAQDLDQVLSTVFLYRPLQKKVIVDSVSIKEFAVQPLAGEAPATSVREALAGAATLAPRLWNAAVWNALGETNP